MMLPLLLALVVQDPAPAILGRWEGRSTCVQASGNSACKDEVVRYDFVRDSVHPGEITLHAFKQVGQGWDDMGDLNVRWDSAGRRWVGGFQNSRTHIEWIFWVAGTELHGKLETLPDRRKTRDVVVHR